MIMRRRLSSISKPGTGSTFTIVLPPSAVDRSTTQTPAPNAVTIGSGFKILVAEDEVDVRRVLELMDAHKFDLLISDVIMPDMKGPELYAAALGKQADLKVLFVSGYTEDVLSDLQRSGVDHAYLAKPFSISPLSAAIANIITSDQ